MFRSAGEVRPRRAEALEKRHALAGESTITGSVRSALPCARPTGDEPQGVHRRIREEINDWPSAGDQLDALLRADGTLFR